ncbi:MAG TPA: prepilin peptidase, partial [bacterium]|nr:prepilin peptidase [bacterium]
MTILSFLFVFILGLITGSFLNVLVLRYHSGQTIGGRSHCLSCGKTLAWYELLPVISFLVQRGRCLGCQSKISWQYPLVELLTGLLFVLAYLQFSADGWLSLAFYLVIISLFVAITVYDLRHKIIPDLFVWLVGILALLRPILLSNFDNKIGNLWSDYQMVILGGLAAGGIFLLLWLMSRGQWLGFGDVKLALVVGFLLGPIQVFSALILAVWLGAVVGLILVILTKTGLFGF